MISGYDSDNIGDDNSIDHWYRSSIGCDGDSCGSSCFDHPAGRAPWPAMALAQGVILAINYEYNSRPTPSLATLSAVA